MSLKLAVCSWQLAKKNFASRLASHSLPPLVVVSRFTIFYFLFSIFFSCKSHKPDISNIKVDLEIDRFEKDLFLPDTANRDGNIEQLIHKYGDFFFFYFNDYAPHCHMRSESDNSWKDSVEAYIADQTLRALYDSVEKKFPDPPSFQIPLTTSFRYLKFYFPQIILPKVITVINGPGHGAFTYGDSTLCIVLDDYMSPEFSFYRFQDIPQYLIWRFRPEYIVPNCMQVMITHQFPFDASAKKLLDAMVYNGKVLYLRSKVMPDAPDSLVTDFRNSDLKWCKDNEPEIWKFFITKNLLYSQDPLQYLKYVNDGPTTSGMPPESPGNVGSWVGWRIVSSYMEKHPDVTLQQLMMQEDAQKILTESKYKP